MRHIAGAGDPQPVRKRPRKTVYCSYRHRSERPACRLTQGLWHPAKTPPHCWGVPIAIVATEGFIPTIARKRHRDMLPRQFHHQMRRQLRAVGKRLVIHGRQLRHQRQCILTCQTNLGMVRSQVRSHGTRMGRLIILTLIETDGEGTDFFGAVGLHQRRNGGGVQPARKQRTQRHICQHLSPHRLTKMVRQRIQRLSVRTDKGMSRTLLRHISQRPVRLGLCCRLPAAN